MIKTFATQKVLIINLKKRVMTNLRNSVQLIGNLGGDPEIKKYDGDKTMAKISLATTDMYYNSEGNKVKETHWHNLVLWGRQASLAEKYLKKGSEIAVEGKLTSRSYEDKNGTKKYITEVHVNELLMLRSPKEETLDQL